MESERRLVMWLERGLSGERRVLSLCIFGIIPAFCGQAISGVLSSFFVVLDSYMSVNRPRCPLGLSSLFLSWREWRVGTRGSEEESVRSPD